MNDIFDPKYEGKVEMVTELREVVPLVMKADGIDPADGYRAGLARHDREDQAGR